MSLLEKPLTRREVYLAKAAGQEVTLPETDLTREEQYLRAIAEGGGGGVTPEYVAEAIAEAKADIEAEIPTKTSDLTNDSGYAAIDDTTAAQDKAYSSAKVEEKVAGEEIATTATGSDLTLSTSAGSLNALTVYGKSEVVNGSIISAGEGWDIVDLGTLEWSYTQTADYNIFEAIVPNMYVPQTPAERVTGIISALYPSSTYTGYTQMEEKSMLRRSGKIIIKDGTYTSAETFKTAMSGVILTYELADHTQGNAIAVKTDDGSGINGTMATFSTGTPLRGIPDTTVRDIMQWDGSAGTVTKNCGEVDLGTQTITLRSTEQENYNTFRLQLTNINSFVSNSQPPKLLSSKFTPVAWNKNWQPYQMSMISTDAEAVVFTTPKSIATVEDFMTEVNGVKLVYELATPTTQNLTASENASIAGLRTFTPQTHIQNNAHTEMTVEAYAGTANGKALADLKSELKITQSDTLTLTTSGWSNNAQTVTYAHDTAKRNVIDVDPSSVEEWASCGVLATAETTSGITFTCKTVPENALNFRVTSMGV